MKNILTCIGFLLATCFMTGCASLYRPVDPRRLKYNTGTDSKVVFEYRYDVLTHRNNRKYAALESRKNLSLVAVRLTNNTQDTLTFGRDILLLANGKQTTPLDNSAAYKMIRQPLFPYLLYGLLIYRKPDYYNCPRGNCSKNSNPFIPVGMVIAGGNIAVAAVANNRFKQEMTDYNLYEKRLLPGQTVYGIIVLGTREFPPLTVRVR